jgi:CheY-like chemotaxis protein
MESKGATVLLVEDDDRDALAIRMAFVGLGMGEILRRVSSADAAIDFLSDLTAAGDPGLSLILVSLALSRKSDFKILRWMRKQKSIIRRIPYIVLAASRQPPGFEVAYDLGAVSYLVKPIDPEALRSMMKAVLDFWRLDGRK